MIFRLIETEEFIMNYQESREYIGRITREIPSVLGLDHMRELMKRLGNPQDDLKYVHVAGTNGKGSVIAFLYSVLSEAGYRVGRYVSPTLYSYRGRMEVSGSRISREKFAAYITQVADAITAMTKEISSLQSQIADISADNDEAYKEIDASVDLETVYNKATKEFGMVPAGKGQVYKYKNKKSDRVIQYSDIPE